MKTALAHLLLFCYIVGLCKPVSPIVEDIFSHTFFKLQHISSVHLENGHYHVHQELKEAGKDVGSPIANQNQNSKKTVSFLAIHILPELPTTSLQLLLSFKLVFHNVAYLLLSGIAGIPAQPPEY
jgi:hypothetical protein